MDPNQAMADFRSALWQLQRLVRRYDRKADDMCSEERDELRCEIAGHYEDGQAAMDALASWRGFAPTRPVTDAELNTWAYLSDCIGHDGWQIVDGPEGAL